MTKRLAPIALVVVLVLVLGVVARGCFLIGGGKSATATASNTATGAAPWYAPYVDASLTMPKFPSRQVVLSFITGNGCTPTWNATPLAQATAINTRIQQTQALGDQVIASFGGETGPEPAVSCSDPSAACRFLPDCRQPVQPEDDRPGHRGVRVAQLDRQRSSRGRHRHRTEGDGEGRQAARRLGDAGSDAIRPAA